MSKGRPKSAYSGAQLEVIRAALRAHKHHYRDSDGKELGWKGIALDIEDTAGVQMGPEVLRQFVEGVSKKGDPGRIRVPSDENLAAIVTYLSDPEIGALEPDELELEQADLRIASRLLSFLRLGDETPLNPTARIDGHYRATRSADHVVESFELHLHPPSGDGVMSAIETLYVYDNPSHVAKSDTVMDAGTQRSNPGPMEALTGDPAAGRMMGGPNPGGLFQSGPQIKDFEDFDPEEEREYLTKTTKGNGFAVVTPEDNLLIVIKNEAMTENHYWLLLLEEDFWSDKPVESLVMLRHAYPIDDYEPSTPGWYMRSAILGKKKEDLFVFQRVSPAP